MTETWKPIAEFPDYEVSTLGRVRRANPGRGAQAGRMCTPRPGWGGYPTVTLTKSGTKRFVHRLVAEAFLGPCPPGHEVHHKNHDRQDPSASNLQYVTRAQNIAHAKQAGRLRRLRGEENPHAKLNEDQVRSIRAEPGTLRAIAAKYGISHRTVERIRKGQKWAHISTPPSSKTP